MKIILSRKGFDSKYGGIPSPILPDGKMISLPIPSTKNSIRLCDLELDRVNLGKLVSELTSSRKLERRVNPAQTAHLDPDIYAGFHREAASWLPAFGQGGAAQSHLANNNVGLGDVFLFFGWFRQLETAVPVPHFAKESRDVHVVYGWLQIGEVWDIDSQRARLLATHPELAIHPHVADYDKYRGMHNTLYVASRRMSVRGATVGNLPGAGVFDRYDRGLQLTAKGSTRSIWRMPATFMPRDGQSVMTRIKPGSWTRYGDSALVKSGGIGQEFVLDTERCPGAVQWLTNILGLAAQRCE